MSTARQRERYVNGIIIYYDITTFVAIAMDRSITEPDEEDEETVCSRTTQARQEPKGTGE